MDGGALASRRATCGTAGPSHRCAQPAAVLGGRGLSLGSGRCSARPTPAGAAVSHVIHNHSAAAHWRTGGQQPRGVVCRSGKLITPSPLWDEVAERDGFRIVNPDSVEPDFADPDWIDKVEDWDDFWNYTVGRDGGGTARTGCLSQQGRTSSRGCACMHPGTGLEPPVVGWPSAGWLRMEGPRGRERERAQPCMHAAC